jgi:hypothetical protein
MKALLPLPPTSVRPKRIYCRAYAVYQGHTGGPPTLGGLLIFLRDVARYVKTKKDVFFLLCHQFHIDLFIIHASALYALFIIPQEHVSLSKQAVLWIR